MFKYLAFYFFAAATLLLGQFATATASYGTTHATSLEAASQVAQQPKLSARSALVFEASGGQVILDKNSNVTRSIASTTKLMTALLTLEKSKIDTVFKVPAYKAAAVESVAGLRAGDEMTVGDLLSAMMLPSGNDASVALAKNIGGSVANFVKLMNERAQQLGLQAQFTSPIGLDAQGHYASASDLVKLTLLLRRFSEFRKIVDQPSTTLKSASPPITVKNRNTLVSTTPWVNGVKTGHTRDAGYCLVASATRRGITLVSVVLGTKSEAARDSESLAILRYGFSQLKSVSSAQVGGQLATVPVKLQGRTVKVGPAKVLKFVLRKGQRLTSQVTGLPAQIEGPLDSGSKVGRVAYLVDGKEVGATSAVTIDQVQKASVFQRLKATIFKPVTLVLFALIVGATYFFIRRRPLQSLLPRLVVGYQLLAESKS